MAEKDIIQNKIFQLGQSQNERLPQELKKNFAEIDGRTRLDLLQFTKAFAEFVNYYRLDPETPVGNWRNFFPEESTIEQLLTSDSGNTDPHLSLFLAFLELYKEPQKVMNQITTSHLDFYYQDVLQLEKKIAIADKVHLLLELKKNAAPIPIAPEHLFSAGKDATKVELIYAPTRETIVNSAKVESLRSVFFDRRGQGTIRYAPIANSADGLGGKLPANEPNWSGFGNSSLPSAEVGFAIASPVLRMQEGDRQVTVALQLNNVDGTQLNDTLLNGSFDLFITGEKNWLGPYTVSPTLSADNLLEFKFTVPETEKPIIDYNATIHGYSYVAQAPIIQVLLRADNTNIGYKNFSNVTLETASVAVEVSKITSLSLENDLGTLDPKKAFLPFGPQPTKGSRFLVGYPEALAKKLSKIELEVQWQDAPVNFSNHYSDYGIAIANSNFTATVSFKDSGSWSNISYGVQLFKSNNATSLNILSFSPNSSSLSSGVSQGMKIYALSKTNSLWALNAASNLLLQSPVFFPYQTAVPEPQTGSITFSLERDFLHATYRKKYIENVLEYNQPNLEIVMEDGKISIKNSKEGSGTPVILNEPYTPTIQSISLSYKAHSAQIKIDSTSEDDFANRDLQFFHIKYFGQMLEHAYQRQQVESRLQTGISTRVSLLPSYNNAGELLIGFRQLNTSDSVSVLFQVAEGSADPDLPPEELQWFVLCDNYWKLLKSSEVVLDTTNQLLTSGIIQFVIPSEATTQNTILPSGLIWIKAAIKDNTTAVCQLIDVAANAVEVQFVDRGNDPQHLRIALEPDKIAKLKNRLSAIKAVKQPYASFGGSPVENDEAFYTRTSERLRHKNRCLTAWDYERIILEGFPKVYQVKCIPHANENSWLAPGHVLIVVIPDLKNKNAMNRFEPKVDADTINRITDHVQKIAGMQVRIKVKNPRYQKVNVDFKVKFYPGYEFNYYSNVLNQELIKFLAPWAYDSRKKISFGGKIYKSVLLDFVEDLPYLDYVTDFKMYSPREETTNYTDINEVQPNTPDTILVSDPTHIISSVL